MAALNDPNYIQTGGKKVEEAYVPEDDFALMRLMQKIKEMGEATFEQKIERMGDLNKYITKTQFDGFLNAHDTAANDYLPMNRIAGFNSLQGAKKMKISQLMFNVNNREAMKEQVEEQTLTHIAQYMETNGWDLNRLFNYFNSDEDEFLSDTEFFDMLGIIHVNVNQQLRRILLSMFDQNRDGKISKQEFKSKLEKYTKKAPITAD